MGVSQLRLVVTAADYDEALRLYRDALGLAPAGLQLTLFEELDD